MAHTAHTLLFEGPDKSTIRIVLGLASSRLWQFRVNSSPTYDERQVKVSLVSFSGNSGNSETPETGPR